MKIKSAILISFMLIFFISNNSQAQTGKDKKEKKEQAKVDGAKADALLQKNEIYDQQVLDKKNDETAVVQQNRAKTHFHKRRKLSHRLRRRRF